MMNIVLNIKETQLQQVLETLSQTGKVVDIVINIEEERVKETTPDSAAEPTKDLRERTKETES